MNEPRIDYVVMRRVGTFDTPIGVYGERSKASAVLAECALADENNQYGASGQPTFYVRKVETYA